MLFQDRDCRKSKFAALYSFSLKTYCTEPNSWQNLAHYLFQIIWNIFLVEPSIWNPVDECSYNMTPPFYCILGRQKQNRKDLGQARGVSKPSVSSFTNSNASSHRLNLQLCWLLLNSKWSGGIWMSSSVLKNNHLLLEFLILGIRSGPSPLSCDPHMLTKPHFTHSVKVIVVEII